MKQEKEKRNKGRLYRRSQQKPRPLMWPWVKSPYGPVNIPTKKGSKMGGAPKTPKMVPLVLTHMCQKDNKSDRKRHKPTTSPPSSPPSSPRRRHRRPGPRKKPPGWRPRRRRGPRRTSWPPRPAVQPSPTRFLGVSKGIPSAFLGVSNAHLLGVLKGNPAFLWLVFFFF